MKHNKKHFQTLLTPIFAAFLSLFLFACDNSNGDQAATGTANGAAEVYTGPDYSEMVTASEVRGSTVFGEVVMGNPDAPITMVEYASLTCPHCATFHNNIFPELKEKYIKTGKVKLVFRNFIRDQLDVAVSMITRCYGPDKFFDLMDLYFLRQRQWLTQEPLPEISAIARTAGISRVDLDACISNTELQAHLLDMQKDGRAEGVSGTPTFFINDQQQVGPGSVELFEKIFEGEL